jgi:hypothetical protein
MSERKLNHRGRPHYFPTRHLAFCWEGERFDGWWTLDPRGRIAELGLKGERGSVPHMTTARLASLALSVGVDLADVRKAVIGGPLARMIDKIILGEE